MTLQEAVGNAVRQLANVSRSEVFATKEGTSFAFLTPVGLCLIGITRWKEGSDYVDIRWRVLIGEITPSFNLMTLLKRNHLFPDTPYGLVSLGGKQILSITDTYRFLLSWGSEEIQNIMVGRFGGAFAIPLAPPGVRPISDAFFSEVMQQYGLSKLLG